jgi:membrane protein DedA with SNARE-associated domain
VTHLLIQHGLVLLFAAVAIESAGVPIPGETALITAAFLASPGQDHYKIWWVIVIAAAGAIVGDNIGYWIGREGGRRVLERWSFVKHHADRVLPPAERFFKQHGGKTIFIGRFLAILRVTAAWLAGISRYPWWKFFLWNASGGIAWATAIGLIAYYAGKPVADAISRYGLYAVLGIIVVVILGAVAMRLLGKRLVKF